MNIAIQTKNLSKFFYDTKDINKAVDELSFEVYEGEIFGLLGPNGAGKTTTMRMLTTLLKPTSGSAFIMGHNVITDAETVRRCIGYVSQSGGLERSATGRENLILQAKIFGSNYTQANKRVDELVRDFDLDDFANRYVQTYSGGQRRRTDIALGLVHKPQVLFLDEPTVGLDPQSRAQVWKEIKKLQKQGTTIIITTHYLDEADQLCDRVAIIDHGDIVALGSPAQLKHSIANDTILLTIADKQLSPSDYDQLFGPIDGVREIIVEKNTVRLFVAQGDVLLPKILRTCDAAGIPLQTISLHHPTLDDVFLQKTGRSLTQEGTSI